jgi:hypothetical protein
MQEYMDADFILASAAIVERLWSLANHILMDTRKQMTPIVFESLIFLKVNDRFWDQDLVSRAVAVARTERSKEHVRREMQSSRRLHMILMWRTETRI